MADCLGKITTSGKHLLALINDVPDMSKIEAGEISLNDEEFEITEVIDELISINKPLSDAKGHEVVVHIDLAHETVIGDRLRLQQVFTNLFNNAVKYTPNGGRIEISFREKPAKSPKMSLYEFSARDNGVGMSEDYLPHVFEVFTREDNTPKNTSQGTGLGLAITRNIVRMIDGDISVESKLGEGSVFTATMFLKLPDKRDIKYEDLIDLDVLVVDDDEITCESVKITLEKLDMRCDTVTSGREAVRMVKEKAETADGYFAVLLDWKMPGMDGVETSRAIRSDAAAIPVFAMTANAFDDDNHAAIAAGMNEHIAKPIDVSTIFKILGEYLK